MLFANIKIANKFVSYHSIEQRFWLAGRVLKNGVIQSPAELYKNLSALSTTDIESYLEQLDGFFSLVMVTEMSVVMISDRLRSYPLFYATTKAGLWVSDDFEFLVYQLELNESDQLAAAEFLQLGYVTGTATTVLGVMQVPASSCLRWDGVELSIGRYFEFLPLAKRTCDLLELKQQLSIVMGNLTRQLISRAAGRQIVVPLSGGLDSKALLLSLYLEGYENLCCFTFGAADSWELNHARKLCAELGVVWHPVIYNAATFTALRTDNEFSRYTLFIHSGVSVPNVQVYPAIRSLVHRGIIQPDALLIPGHTGDFVSGGHRKKRQSDAATVVDVAACFIWQTHYQLRRHCPLHKQLFAKLSAELTQIVALQPNIDAADLAEAWNFRERQAKLIVNSNRYYEFFKLSWWMPFWQRDFVNYWLAVPEKFRLNQVLWREWVDELQAQILPGYQSPAPERNKSKIWPKASAIFDYFTDRNRLLTIVPFHRWLLYRLRLTKRSGNLFGYLADKTLSLAKGHRYYSQQDHNPIETKLD